MSRVGKKPIIIPLGVTVTATDYTVMVKGPKGELKRNLPPGMSVEIGDKELTVVPKIKNKRTPALWGLTRSLIANMVSGVVKEFEKKLEFEGVGYRVAVEGDSLAMQLGFSHPVKFKAPAGIKFAVVKNTITVSGPDKELVGDITAQVRRLKPVEPYKGKGIRYQGEVVRRKAGKKAVATA